MRLISIHSRDFIKKIFVLIFFCFNLISVSNAGVCSNILNKIVKAVKINKTLDDKYQNFIDIFSSKVISFNKKETFDLYRKGFSDQLLKNENFKKIGFKENKSNGTLFKDTVSELTDQVIVTVRKIPDNKAQIISGKVLFVSPLDHKDFSITLLTKNKRIRILKKDLYSIHALRTEKLLEDHVSMSKKQRFYFTVTDYFKEGMDHKFKFFFKVRNQSETPELIKSDNKFLNYLGQSGYISKSNFDESFFYWLNHPIHFSFMLPQKIYWKNFNKSLSFVEKYDLFVPSLFNGLMETFWRRRIDGVIRYLSKFTKFSEKTNSMLDKGPITASFSTSMVAGIASFGIGYSLFDSLYDKDLLKTKLDVINSISDKYLKLVFLDPLFQRVREKYLPTYKKYDESIFKNLSKKIKREISEEVYVRLTATDDYYYGLLSKKRNNLIQKVLFELKNNNQEYLDLTSEASRKELEKFIIKLTLAHSNLQDMSASVLFPASKQLAYSKGPRSTKNNQNHGIVVSLDNENKLANDEQIVSLMDINNKQLLERWLLIEMGGTVTKDLPIMLTARPELLELFNELMDDEYIQFLIKKGKGLNEIGPSRLVYLLLEYSSWKEKFSRWELFSSYRYELIDGEKVKLSIDDFIEERKKSLNEDNERIMKFNSVDFFDTTNFDNTYLARIPKKDMLGLQAGRLIGPVGRQFVRFKSIINLATRNRMKAHVRGDGSYTHKIVRDQKTNLLKSIAKKRTIINEVINKLGTVLISADLWSRCDGKQDILDLDKITGQNPFIRKRENSFDRGVYNYFRSVAFCLNIKSAMGMNERKLNPKINIKKIDKVSKALAKFMSLQIEDIN